LILSPRISFIDTIEHWIHKDLLQLQSVRPAIGQRRRKFGMHGNRTPSGLAVHQADQYVELSLYVRQSLATISSRDRAACSSSEILRPWPHDGVGSRHRARKIDNFGFTRPNNGNSTK
jgi:hypothetical protein